MEWKRETQLSGDIIPCHLQEIKTAGVKDTEAHQHTCLGLGSEEKNL